MTQLDEWAQCFATLGATLGDADLHAIGALANRIKSEGEVALKGGSTLDAMLAPTLEHLDVDDLDELDEDALRTVGGAIACFRLLAADDGDDSPSLVPSAYVPIATLGAFEVVGLIGVGEEARGRYFEISPEGQNQTITSEADLTDLGVLSELVVPAAP